MITLMMMMLIDDLAVSTWTRLKHTSLSQMMFSLLLSLSSIQFFSVRFQHLHLFGFRDF